MPSSTLLSTPARIEGAQVGVVLLAAFLWRLWLSLHGWPAIDSDEASVGLMTRHILAGERPIFFYGQQYTGPFEAYFSVPFFLVFGATVLALRLSMLTAVMIFLALVYLLGRAAYNHAVGLATLILLAIGPAFALLRELTAIGNYQEIWVLSSLLVVLTYAQLRRAEPLPRGRDAWLRTLGLYALLGLVAGLGFWANQLTLPFTVMAVLALAVCRWQEVRHWAGLALVIGFLVGCWPFLVYNLQHAGITFTELSAQNRVPRQVGPLPPLPAWSAQIGSMLAVGLPAVMGSPHVCVNAGGVWGNYPPLLAVANARPGGLCGGLNVLFSLLLTGCYAVVAWQLGATVWRWRTTRRQPRRRFRGTSTADPVRRAQLWLRAMLVVPAFGILALYSVSVTAQRYQFTAARYLLPLYITLPLVVGVLWSGAEPARRWIVEQSVARVARAQGSASVGAARAIARSAPSKARGRLTRGTVWRAGPAGRPRRVRSGAGTLALWLPRAHAWIATAGLALLLVFALIGAVAAGVWESNGARYALPAPPVDRTVIQSLEAHGVSLYVSDYWTCYRLAFESGERLRCAVRDSANNTLTSYGAVNRISAYLVLVKHAAHPAYVWYADSVQDRTFDAWAASQHLPHIGYARYVIDGYAVDYYPTARR
jgi:4-amino-4-deoxy-L-arabinose transferase-like glycosyltransferase